MPIRQSSESREVAHEVDPVYPSQRETIVTVPPTHGGNNYFERKFDAPSIVIVPPTHGGNNPSTPARRKTYLISAIVQAVGGAISGVHPQEAERRAFAAAAKPTAPVALAAKPKRNTEEKSVPISAPVQDVHTISQTDPPAWVEAGPKMVGDEYWMPIKVGPYESPLENELELLKATQAAVGEYAELYLSESIAKTVQLPEDILRQLIRMRWEKIVPLEAGGTVHKMVELHALVAITGAVREQIKASSTHAVSIARLRSFGMGLGGVLGLLAIAYAGLKIDEKTRGRYRGKLGLAGLMAIVIGGMLAFL